MVSTRHTLGVVRVDVWSDFLCPFCHLGRRQLQLALEQFEHADETEVIWHSFQLDRSAPDVAAGSNTERVAEKYGVSVEQMRATQEAMARSAAEVGLDYQWQRTVAGNSYAAHRLHHYARSVGREDEFMDRLMRGWYSEGASVGDHATLTALAADAGLDAEAVASVLAGDDFGQDVRTDLALAHQIGITSVPTFVLDQKYGVSGAQGVEPLLKALDYAWADRGNRPAPAAGGCGGSGGCGGGGCGGGGACGTHDESEHDHVGPEQH